VERYRHTQFSRLLALGFLAMAAVCGYVVLVSGQWLAAAMMILLLITMAVFSSLTTSVGDGFLEVWFGSGIVRRKLGLTQIESVSVVHNPWYFGWGIHWTPDGWLWNVFGSRAVELHFRDGRRFRIGTDEPENLAAAIRAEISAG